MKKSYLTGVLAALLAVPAMGVTLNDATYTLIPTADNESVTLSGVSGNFYTTLKLDVDAFAAAVTSSTSQTTIVSVQGAASTHLEGLTTTLAAGGLTGNTSTAGAGNAVTGTDYAFTSNTENGHHIADGLDSIDWTSVTGVAVTFVHRATSLSCAFLSVQTADGAITEYYGGNSSYHYSSLSPVEWNVNSDLVQAAFYFNGTLDQAGVTALNHEAISYVVPEPATATLSLLALAGLAARRRRA